MSFASAILGSPSCARLKLSLHPARLCPSSAIRPGFRMLAGSNPCLTRRFSAASPCCLWLKHRRPGSDFRTCPHQCGVATATIFIAPRISARAAIITLVRQSYPNQPTTPINVELGVGALSNGLDHRQQQPTGGTDTRQTDPSVFSERRDVADLLPEFPCEL